MDKKLNVFLLTSTHWDREWYDTFQGFRWRLIDILDDAMNKLDENPEIETFTLDGQTIVLEDYTEIVPENKERLQNLIKEGRITVGPWYVMPDELIPSGESLIRNINIGHKVARSWGVEPMKYGYVCDIFGHTAQMPQILAGFDINGALLGRGATEERFPAHFRWCSPDGSEVTTFKTPDLYGYGEYWIRVSRFEGTEEEKDANIRKYLDGELLRTDIPVVMLVDGQDHQPMHAASLVDTKKRIERLYPGSTVRIVSPELMAQHLEQYREQLPKRVGNLTDTSRKQHQFARLLTNTLSSRYDLKRENAECQTLMEKWAGPLTALSRLTGNTPIRKNYYDIAYRYLITNHPHDSICGCSIDQVHRDMKYRFAQVKEINNSIAQYGLVNLSRCTGHDGNTHILTLVNPLPFRRKETVTVDIWFNKEFPYQYSEPFGYEHINSFLLIDKDGNEIPYKVTNISRNKVHLETGWLLWDDRHTVVFEADLPACGRAEYKIVPNNGPTRYFETLRTGTYTAENELVKLTVNTDGTIDIHDKRTGETYANQIIFEDNIDIGDGWNYSAATCDRKYISAATPVSIAVTCDAPDKCSFEIKREMLLPTGYSRITENVTDYRRNDEHNVVEIIATVSLTKSSPMVDVALSVNNTVKDHRLRLIIPTGVTEDRYYASQAFYVDERSASINNESAKWEEPEHHEKSMQSFAFRRNGKRGLAFISGGGLHEIGAFNDGDGTLAVTLLRCVSMGGNNHFLVDGQMPGISNYRFGLLPMLESDSYADLQRLSDSLSTGVIFRENKTCFETPEEHSFFSVTGDGNTVFSTMKLPEDGEDGIIIRLYNLSDKADNSLLTFDREVKEAKLVTLDEKETKILSPDVNTVKLTLSPWKIQTILIKF